MAWPDLSRRVVKPERMDDPALPADEHRAALRGLRRINRVSNSAGILWPALEPLARQLHPRPLRVLDLATGSGDVPLALAPRARRCGAAINIDACDRSDAAINAARHATGDDARVSFHVLDALTDPFPSVAPRSYDVVMCSLFLHHLPDDAAIVLLRRMTEATRHLVVINDLERCRLGYVAAWLGTRLLSRSPVVHDDGPQSVAAAFTAAELVALAQQAGMSGAVVTRHRPWRLRLIARQT